jgi:hypothetical protein
MDLNDAEMSRFVDTLDWDSNVADASKYINFYIKDKIKKLDPKDENYNFFYTRFSKILALANALFNDYRFEFDSRDDLLDLFNDKAKMLNQRAITDALMAHGYSKAKFLNWVDKYSKFLEKDIVMIHEILDDYTEPTINVGNTASETSAEAETQSQKSANADDDNADFDSVFGMDGDEVDSDLFGGTTASNAGAAAKVSSADALNRIKSFDFSL